MKGPTRLKNVLVFGLTCHYLLLVGYYLLLAMCQFVRALKRICSQNLQNMCQHGLWAYHDRNRVECFACARVQIRFCGAGCGWRKLPQKIGIPITFSFRDHDSYYALFA